MLYIEIYNCLETSFKQIDMTHPQKLLSSKSFLVTDFILKTQKHTKKNCFAGIHFVNDAFGPERKNKQFAEILLKC